MYIQSYSDFKKVEPLEESIQQAKDYLLKRYATGKGIKTSEIGEEDKRKILSDPRFIKIRDLTQKHPAVAPLLLKGIIEDGANEDEIEQILELLERYKGNLKQDLALPILDYFKIVPTEEDSRPGYEVLWDDLRNIPRKIKLRKLYNEFTPRLKKSFAEATEEQISKLEEITNQLSRLPDKDNRSAWKSFLGGMNQETGEYEGRFKKYDDTRTYPEYSDPKVAFADLIKDADIFIEKWQESDDEMVRKLKDLGPEVGFLYQKNGYIVISTRTPEALRTVAGDSNWCINNDSTFWSYGGGRIQLVIMNNNRPNSDPKSLYGITVTPDRKVYTDAVGRRQTRITDKNGSNFNGRPLKDLLQSQDFPNELIEKVMDSFEEEKGIKLILEEFYKKEKQLTEEQIIKSLINLNKGFLNGVIPPDQWEQVSGVVSQIIEREANIPKAKFLDFFKRMGIVSVAGLNVFKKVIKDEYTSGDIDIIVEKVNEIMETIKELLEIGDASAFGGKEGFETAKRCVDNEKLILSELENMK